MATQSYKYSHDGQDDLLHADIAAFQGDDTPLVVILAEAVTQIR